MENFVKVAHLPQTSALIRAEKLSVGTCTYTILRGLHFSILHGMKVAVIGPNGGGKSTLLSLLARPDSPTFKIQGTLECHYTWGLDVAYLPQASQAQRTFPLLVRDVVAGGMWRELGALSPLTPHHRQRIEDALTNVGLQGMGAHPLSHLSGGQFQRVLFARMSVQNASVLLLDEPFTGVDTFTQEALLPLIQTWHTQGKTILAVLHDLECVKRFFPHTLMVARGFSRFGPTEAVVTPENLKLAYESAHMWPHESPI